MTASPSPSPELEDISVGTVLDGRYRIDALLGSGGMGRVYAGEHTGIGKRVAIKVLHADLSRNREAAQRFQREAIASGRLDHTNIVGVSDFGIVENGPCYLVMEILEGESLGTRIVREKRLPWRDAIGIMRGVLAGLAHAHDRGVVHRDIKPDNVFLATKDGETVVKILDFGIAKLYAGSPDDPASTRAGLTVGTPAYLSPEQAVGGEIKPQSDLYSATVLLFEMITGRAPFEDKDPLAMLGAHVSRTPPTIAEVAPELGVPQALEEIIQKGLVKAQAERIESAAHYSSMLDAVTAAAPSFAPVTPVATSDAIASLGHANTQSLTPMPIATPPPGTIPRETPPPLAPSTPQPFHVSNAAPTLALPTATRSISLADAPPIPRNWIKIGVIVLGAALVLAIVLAIAGRGAPATPAKPAPKTSIDVKADAKDTKPAPKVETKPEAKTVPRPPPKKDIEPAIAPPEPPVDDSAQLKPLLHTLANGKTCAARKAAIPKLVELGDKSAIPALKRARYRGRGGLLGIGEKNANACLRASADAAIKSLGGSTK